MAMNPLEQIGGKQMVASEGFEPPKATPADLQSDPFGRLGNSPLSPPTTSFY